MTVAFHAVNFPSPAIRSSSQADRADPLAPEQQREQQHHRTAPDNGRQTWRDKPALTDYLDEFGLHRQC